MTHSKIVKVRNKRTITDPHGDYDVIYVDVMQGKARVRRFVKPISKDDITVNSLINKAEKFIEDNPQNLTSSKRG